MKRFQIILVIGLIILISGCTSTPQPLNATSNSSEMDAEPTVIQPVDTEIPEIASMGNCTNDFYPVLVGTTWHYEGSGTMVGAFQFTRSITDVSENGFSDKDVWGDGLVRTGTWSCQAGNLTANNQGGMATVSLPANAAAPIFEAETIESDGMTIPASMVIGQNWEQSLNMSGSMDISEGLNAFVSNETHITCTPESSENVNVPAGTFEAIKVNCEASMAISVDMGTGSNQPITFNSNSTIWYAEGVGMIKLVDSSEIGETTISLTEYAIPGL